MVPPKLAIKNQHFSQTTAKKRNSKINQKIKKRSLQRRAKRKAKQQNICITSAMSAWAENFTMAATWQLKHQIAYWKARAVSLEYENRMLHEVIRSNHMTVPTTSKLNGALGGSEETNISAENSDQSDSESEENESDKSESESDNEENQNENEEDFEVSEEFIQFLTANAKYREDARKEKERLKAKEREASLIVEARESAEDRMVRKKQLYGENFKRIVALESYLQSDFNEKVDKSRAAYWPNIPFNFSVK